MTLNTTVLAETSKSDSQTKKNDAESLYGERMQIASMLSYRRPHDSKGEAEFLARYIFPLGVTAIVDDTFEPAEVHAFTLRIEGSEAQNQRAFCAHVDSVHNRLDMRTRQPVGYDKFRDEFFVSDTEQRDCLGADDAAGCYVLLRMIEAKVPGLYVFFRGEERGGIGSTFVTEHRPDVFEGITQAIQFDRRGTKSIITEMMCGETCSLGFAAALSEALGLEHEEDPTGSFTDTANLAQIVQECTNVSCGYNHEHSSNETLDAAYLLRLADACITTFSDAELELPVNRAANYFGEKHCVVFSRSASYSSSYSAPSEIEVYSETFGMVSAYDLPNMSYQDLRILVSEIDFEDYITLLEECGSAIKFAYPTYY